MDGIVREHFRDKSLLTPAIHIAVMLLANILITQVLAGPVMEFLFNVEVVQLFKAPQVNEQGGSKIISAKPALVEFSCCQVFRMCLRKKVFCCFWKC